MHILKFRNFNYLEKFSKQKFRTMNEHLINERIQQTKNAIKNIQGERTLKAKLLILILENQR